MVLNQGQFYPRGHLARSEDIFGTSDMLQNIQQCARCSPQQKCIEPVMSVALRLRSHALQDTLSFINLSIFGYLRSTLVAITLEYLLISVIKFIILREQKSIETH